MEYQLEDEAEGLLDYEGLLVDVEKKIIIEEHDLSVELDRWNVIKGHIQERVNFDKEIEDKLDDLSELLQQIHVFLYKKDIVFEEEDDPERIKKLISLHGWKATREIVVKDVRKQIRMREKELKAILKLFGKVNKGFKHFIKERHGLDDATLSFIERFLGLMETYEDIFKKFLREERKINSPKT